MREYKCLNKQIFGSNDLSLVPLRNEDRYKIMRWRNEQIFHLRQARSLTEQDQDSYFDNVVKGLFDMDKPGQVLFSCLQDGNCIGYGGLVHLNWQDRNAEISFIMDTSLEAEGFEKHWSGYLKLIEEIGFDQLKLHKIFTYAFDLRPRLYPVLEQAGFKNEARLKEHTFFDSGYVDVLIHSKIARNEI